jgi:hypothetical protein
MLIKCHSAVLRRSRTAQLHRQITVKRRLFVLTDLEDRALAACDDQHLAVRIAQVVLCSWFGHAIKRNARDLS